MAADESAVGEAAMTSGDPDPALVRGTVEVAVELR